MAGSTISSQVTSTVTLGSASYPSPLTVTTTGDVAVSSYGATGIDGPAGGGTLINDGTVTAGAGPSGSNIPVGGDGGTGVVLLSGNTATNSGTITGGLGGTAGIYAGSGGSGVYLAAGATLTNQATITGGVGGEITLGTFEGPGGSGVYLGGGSLTNNGAVTGGNGGFLGYSYGGDGVHLLSGMVTNTGTIAGGSGGLSGGHGGVGVDLAGDGTVTNAGVISGGADNGITAYAVLFAAEGTLVVDPGASFIGQVVGNASATDMLYLAAGTGAGTLTGIGAQYVNFTQIMVGSDASWTLTGANTIAATATLTELSGASLTDTGALSNYGAIVLDPSTLRVGALAGNGLVAIGAGSTLEVAGTITDNETIVFEGGGAYVHLGNPDDVAGSINNLAPGETIDLEGIVASTVNYAAGQLTFTGGDIPLALAPDGAVLSKQASADGTDVFATLCFCVNTLILTPAGERPVQDLAVGDLVTTHRGEIRPIVWIGTGKVLTTRGHRTAATPVIVRKGALSDNVPSRDLRVTKGHAFWFGGALIPVEFLINHRLIEWDDRAQEVELYHIELSTHDVLLANGAPAESYRDDGNRWLFRNANLGWDQPPLAPCAPVLTGGSFVDAVWRRLLERAGPRPGFVLTDDPDLHLLVDGERIDAAERHGTAYVFHLPARQVSAHPGRACPSSLRIVSRAGAPAELGVARDPRVLGVAVRQFVLRRGTQFRVIEAANCELTDGFHPFEPADGLRWTDGDAALPEALLQGFGRPMELVLRVGGTTHYPLFGAMGPHATAA